MRFERTKERKKERKDGWRNVDYKTKFDRGTRGGDTSRSREKIIIKWCDYRERRRSKTARSRSIILRFVSGKRNWLLLNIASTIDRRGYLVHVIERKPRE